MKYIHLQKERILGTTPKKLNFIIFISEILNFINTSKQPEFELFAGEVPLILGIPFLKLKIGINPLDNISYQETLKRIEKTLQRAKELKIKLSAFLLVIGYLFFLGLWVSNIVLIFNEKLYADIVSERAYIIWYFRPLISTVFLFVPFYLLYMEFLSPIIKNNLKLLKQVKKELHEIYLQNVLLYSVLREKEHLCNYDILSIIQDLKEKKRNIEINYQELENPSPHIKHSVEKDLEVYQIKIYILETIEKLRRKRLKKIQQPIEEVELIWQMQKTEENTPTEETIIRAEKVLEHYQIRASYFEEIAKIIEYLKQENIDLETTIYNLELLSEIEDEADEIQPIKDESSTEFDKDILQELKFIKEKARKLYKNKAP